MLTDYQIDNDPYLRTYEDFIFNIKDFTHAQKTVIVDEPLYVYTHRGDSLANAYFKKNTSQYIDTLVSTKNGRV